MSCIKMSIRSTQRRFVVFFILHHFMRSHGKRKIKNLESASDFSQTYPEPGGLMGDTVLTKVFRRTGLMAGSCLEHTSRQHQAMDQPM